MSLCSVIVDNFSLRSSTRSRCDFAAPLAAASFRRATRRRLCARSVSVRPSSRAAAAGAVSYNLRFFALSRATLSEAGVAARVDAGPWLLCYWTPVLC